MTALTGETKGEAGLRISVVVCTHNRANKLANCLAQLTDQSLDRLSYEVVVVDDYSTDATPTVADRYATRVVHNERNLGLAASRNVGVAAAVAPIIAFTDDDCVPDREWLHELLEAFSDPGVLGVGGMIIPLRTNHLLLRYYEANSPLAHNRQRPGSGGLRERFTDYVRASLRLNSPPQNAASLYIITGANMALRRSAFELVDGFDELFRLGDEDTDFWLRLHAIQPDALLRYNPRAVVAHDYDPRFRDALRRCCAYGRAAGFAYLEGRRDVPAIFPFPILILFSLGLAAINLALLAVPLAMLILLYPGWLRLAFARRNPAYVGFSVFQAAFELQTTIGFLGYVASARRLRARTT